MRYSSTAAYCEIPGGCIRLVTPSACPRLSMRHQRDRCSSIQKSALGENDLASHSKPESGEANENLLRRKFHLRSKRDDGEEGRKKYGGAAASAAEATF